MKLHCSNNCASFFDVLTVDWGCWNCHFLMYSLACCVNIKLNYTLLCKIASVCLSSVLQCKYAHKVWDALVQVLKIFKTFGSFLKIIGVIRVT